jgi:hypothetical protein
MRDEKIPWPSQTGRAYSGRLAGKALTWCGRVFSWQAGDQPDGGGIRRIPGWLFYAGNHAQPAADLLAVFLTAAFAARLHKRLSNPGSIAL